MALKEISKNLSGVEHSYCRFYVSHLYPFVDYRIEALLGVYKPKT